jgi:sterol desaturase/sphingolipid hydroxylase (fatty acid hydroxylase superfamily)
VGLFSFEQSKAAYRADFALYGIAMVVLSGVLLFDGPRERSREIVVIIGVGLAAWTLIEYAMHRLVFHGMAPFRRLHALHHERPSALICTPTILSASLIGALVFLPAAAWGDLWIACALTLGVLTGYTVYGIAHHAAHHWRADNAWLVRHKRRHALHHHVGQRGWYGVTSGFWDHVFGSNR